LSSDEVAKHLKLSFSQVAEYIFDIQRDSLSTSLYTLITNLIKPSSNNDEIKIMRKSKEKFRQYFLEQNPRFSGPSNSLVKELQDRFFLAAESFMETLFKSLCSRLPSPDSLQMKGDCVLMRSEYDLKNLRMFALAFEKLYTKSEFARLESEINKIKDDEAFIYRIHSRKNERMMEVWKELSLEYKNLFRLVQMIQLVPYSNSNIERDFSHLNLVKTPSRNRLKCSTVEAFLLIKQEENDAIDNLYTKELLQKYNNSIQKKSQSTKFVPVAETRVSQQSIDEKKENEENDVVHHGSNLVNENPLKRPNPISLPERKDLKLQKLIHNLMTTKKDEKIDVDVEDEIEINQGSQIRGLNDADSGSETSILTETTSSLSSIQEMPITGRVFRKLREPKPIKATEEFKKLSAEKKKVKIPSSRKRSDGSRENNEQNRGKSEEKPSKIQKNKKLQAIDKKDSLSERKSSTKK